MTFLPLFFAYLGPETMLPMTSVIAGVAGVLMMFGRSAVRSVVAIFDGRPETEVGIPESPDRLGSGRAD